VRVPVSVYVRVCVVCVHSNFDLHSGVTGGNSANPCDEDFKGAAPFDNPEAAAFRDFVNTQQANLAGYISFHSYSQVYLSPSGWTTAAPSDTVIQRKLARKAVAAIKAVSGTVFTEGAGPTALYLVNGASDDWVYDTKHAIFTATVELRDKGSHGFLLPPDNIKPSGEEIWPAILAHMDAAKTGTVSFRSISSTVTKTNTHHDAHLQAHGHVPVRFDSTLGLKHGHKRKQHQKRARNSKPF